VRLFKQQHDITPASQRNEILLREYKDVTAFERVEVFPIQANNKVASASLSWKTA
jgi:hypothetical protein